MDVLNNPISQQTESTFDEKGYKAFVKRYKGDIVTTLNGNNGCDFEEFTDNEKKQLFLAENTQKWNDMVNAKYAELEKQQDIIA